MARLVVTGGNPQAYKVVKRRHDGRIYSCDAPYGAEIEYLPKRWVRPVAGCGPLALWPTVEKMRQEDGIEIWSAEYVLCHRSKEVWFRAGEEGIPVIAVPHDESILAWRVRLLEQCVLPFSAKKLAYLNY